MTMDPTPEQLGPRTYLATCTAMTTFVTVDADDMIVMVAYPAHRFVGQPLKTLLDWFRDQGECRVTLAIDWSKETPS